MNKNNRICQCDGCQATRVGETSPCELKNPWTLSWGIWRAGNDMSKEQGRNSRHATLALCKQEVARLKDHYRPLKRTLWFANARHNDGTESLNLHY